MTDGPSVPVGERLIWRGQPDPGQVRRRVIREVAGSVLGTAVSLALFLGFTVAVGVGPGLLAFLPIVIGFLAVFWLLPTAWQSYRAYRGAMSQRYLLTDQRLLIQGTGERMDLRLANLPDLGVQPEGSGYGSIYFSPPIGGGPERAMRWAARFVPGIMQRSLLMGYIPDAERVVRLMRQAQAEAASAGESTETDASGRDPVTGRLADEPSFGANDELPLAPVVRAPIMESLAVVPLWFGGLFLVVGLGFLLVMFTSGLPPGVWWSALIPGSFALIGAAMVFARLRWLGGERRLRAHGVTTTGRVVDVAGTGVQVNEVEQWVVRYSFSVMGVEHRGQSRLMPWVAAARYVPGDEVTVRYDPQNPDTSAIFEPSAVVAR